MSEKCSELEGDQDSGGPAFPIVSPDGHRDILYYGMSLRDWFAGQALTGICGSPSNADCNPTFKTVAVYAYKQADAMLKERERLK